MSALQAFRGKKRGREDYQERNEKSMNHTRVRFPMFRGKTICSGIHNRGKCTWPNCNFVPCNRAAFEEQGMEFEKALGQFLADRK
jgi:hypothetical protein